MDIEIKLKNIAPDQAQEYGEILLYDEKGVLIGKPQYLDVVKVETEFALPRGSRVEVRRYYKAPLWDEEQKAAVPSDKPPPSDAAERDEYYKR